MHTAHTTPTKHTKQPSATKVLRLSQKTHRLLKRVAFHNEMTMMAYLDKLVTQAAIKEEKAAARRSARQAATQLTAQVA